MGRGAWGVGRGAWGLGPGAWGLVWAWDLGCQVSGVGAGGLRSGSWGSWILEHGALGLEPWGSKFGMCPGDLVQPRPTLDTPPLIPPLKEAKR